MMCKLGILVHAFNPSIQEAEAELLPVWSIKDSQRFMLRPSLLCKNQNEVNELNEVHTKNYTSTPVLYSPSRISKCPSLNCNSNKILLKWDASLNSYKWTDENISNVNVDPI